MGDCFSPQGMVLLGIVATAISGAFAKLYADGMRSRNDQIMDLIDQRDELLNQVIGGRQVTSAVASEVRRVERAVKRGSGS